MQDYEKKFLERTKAHIDKVNEYAEKIGLSFPNHDKDKFTTLYNGYSKMGDWKRDDLAPEEQKEVDEATYIHVVTNPHHPEYWADPVEIEGFTRQNPNPHGIINCENMTKEAMQEMCCDWAAMSEEFKNTPFEWFDKVNGKRWKFTEEQQKFILNTLTQLWNNSDEKTLMESKIPFKLEDEKDRIRDVLDIMKDIEYGFINQKTGEKVTDRDWIHHNDLTGIYKTNENPLKTIKDKLGICKDQSLAFKYLMNKLHPEDEVKLYALTTEIQGHCVPVYEHNEKWYYAEFSWNNEYGIHGPFESQEELEDYLNYVYYMNHKEDNDLSSRDEVDVEELNENLSTEQLDKIIQDKVNRINRELDKYGFEIELIDEYDFDEEGEDWIAVFCTDIQDNASVFPVAINKPIFEQLDSDWGYHIEKTLWHEVGHGIQNYLWAEFDFEGEEEELAEEFAEYEMGETYVCELLDCLYEFEDSLTESYQTLTEDTRAQLVSKSKNADPYKNTKYGKNRFERKKYSKVANTVKEFNNINMDELFKRDILIMNATVTGETGKYTVQVKMEGVVAEIAKNIKNNNNIFEFKTVIQAITKVFNSSNIQVHCSCDDFKYRYQHALIMSNDNVDGTDKDPGPGKTGMANSSGKGCKHILLVLNNGDWIIKLASVIRNYINYFAEHRKPAFNKLIFPKLYGVPFDAVAEENLVPDDEALETNESIIDVINDWAKNRGKAVKGSTVNPAKGKGKIQGPTNNNKEEEQ